MQFAIIIFFGGIVSHQAFAAELNVELGNAQNVTFVGAIQRWDKDGNHHNLPDPKARIDAPAVDAAAEKTGDKWAFKSLPAGKYDLVVLAKDRVRIEGFQYPPVKEFDPFISLDSTVDEETRDFIIDDIKKSPHYENKVEPLYLGGDAKAVRVLVMLIRDKPTSYESESPGAATIRHEIWQYSWNYGAWQKEKRTKVMDRVLMPRDQLRKWTWLWDAKLGGIEVKDRAMDVKYELPELSPTPNATSKLKGLYPY
ncbi:MAG: hypothetical protein ABSE63_03230 [Thermoguttaceae bacterium]